MYAQKTDFLAGLLERESIRRKTVYCKITLDDKATHPAEIRTHGGRVIQGHHHVVTKQDPAGRKFFDSLSKSDYGLIVIDEVQFLAPEAADFIRNLVEFEAKRVVVAGLDLDYKGEAFGTVAALACYVDEVIKLKSVCAQCEADAAYSHRIIDSDSRFLEGAEGIYKPVCRECFRLIRADYAERISSDTDSRR